MSSHQIQYPPYDTKMIQKENESLRIPNSMYFMINAPKTNLVPFAESPINGQFVKLASSARKSYKMILQAGTCRITTRLPCYHEFDGFNGITGKNFHNIDSMR